MLSKRDSSKKVKFKKFDFFSRDTWRSESPVSMSSKT